jgi:hypothetical protein
MEADPSSCPRGVHRHVTVTSVVQTPQYIQKSFKSAFLITETFFILSHRVGFVLINANGIITKRVQPKPLLRKNEAKYRESPIDYSFHK